MGRKLADLWDYADRLDKRFKCRFCLKEFTGGVVRLRSHLSGVKGGGIRLCSKVSEEARTDALLSSSINVVNKKRKTRQSSSDAYGGSSDICDANCNREVGYLVANFFEMADIDYKMVESSSFINLVNHLSPGSTLPSSLELQSKLIPSFKVEVEQYVSGAKQSWRETGCTLIPKFELNEKGGRSFLSIFGCSRDRTVLLNTFELPTNVDSVDAQFLEETVRSIVQFVGSQNIVQCVVDGSKCGDYFSSFLGSQFPYVSLRKCAARELQLLFEEICRDVAWVGNTFTIIKSIVDYICSDTAILSLMNGKELKQNSAIINLLSSYEMLESILKVKEDLVQLVRSPEWLSSGYGTVPRGSEVTAYIENSKTWELGEKVQVGLRSLFQALRYVNFHDSDSGYLYGLMEIVEHTLGQLRSNNQNMYQRLWDIYMLKKREILSEFHSVATFLNPAYMLTEQAKDFNSYPVISYILGRFIAEDDRQDFINEVEEYKKILSDRSKLYESTAAKAYHHPCKWWETFGQKLTILKNLAIRILSQPCSTSTCKRSMHTVEALQIKEQRELARGVMTDLDLKMNAILMERFNNDKACKREKIELEEFIKPGSNNGESTSRVLKELELRFMIDIESPVRTNRCVEGKNKHRIRICLIDPFTEDVVTEGIPSTLHLIISVVDGHFSTEASSDGHTRDYYDRNELSGECPYITGDLVVTLFRGEGTLGDFSFNCSSVNTESGQYRLAVKTLTGFCEEYRIREGISNDFTVEDAEEESFQKIMAIVEQQNGSFSSNPAQNSFDTNYLLMETHEHYSLQFINTPNDPPQGFYQSLAQTAARRVKKKALTLQLRSHGREVTLKRGSQALAGKRREKKIPEPRRRVCSAGSNNVNQEEDGEAVELKGIDSVSSTAAMTLLGVKGASLSSANPVERSNEVALTTHPSTALQLSLTGGVIKPREVHLASVNDINQQGDALNGVDSTYVIASVKPESPAIRLFGVKVAGSAEGETHEGHSPTAPVMPTTEDSKEISYIGVRKRPLGGRYDAEIQEPGKKNKVLVGTFDTAEEAAIAYDAAARQFLGPYAKTNFLITSKPEINSTTNEDDTPTEVEENRCAGDNCKSDSSVQSTPTKERVIYTDTNNHGKGIEDYEYDVFMSFRGVDTRHSIAKILHQYMVDAGTEAFVDKPATLSGDLIDQAVINAIDKSKISICIFSETFASSAWCLREVEKMVQLNKVILPVFYGVAPDDVHLKTNMYTDDLARHETKYDKVEVQKWREALRKVAKLEGFQLERMSLLASLNELIGVISSMLKVKPKYELQDFVGMEDHVKNALSLLDIESGGKLILGVLGMVGMGKTTLAKCVYNQVMDKFDMYFFLEQDSSLETEMTRMKSLYQKRVLIVLDGVHHTENPIAGIFNTNWFGSGSRIIVTTRNRKLLEKMGNVVCYDMEGMDPERALKLFSKKAFGLDSPPEEYQDLSLEVIFICVGNPLALTVVGTFLHGQEKPCWELVITDMQQTGGQYPPDVITTQEDSFPNELCRGRPLVVRLMTSLHKGIPEQQLWESKVNKVTKVSKAFQEMMTGCKKINTITEAFGEMLRDMVRWGPTGGGNLKTSSSRWPKTEMEALIQLRTNMDSKFLESGLKGPLWEESSAGMKRLGYDLSSRMCKEKWENIIKLSKKVKKLNMKSVTTQRRDFKQLDAIYGDQKTQGAKGGRRYI